MDTQRIIEKLSASSGLDTDASRSMLEAFVSSLRQCCKNGDAVAIPGFGTFQPFKRDEWIATDQETGKRTLMPPSVNVELKLSVVLRKKLIG